MEKLHIEHRQQNVLELYTGMKEYSPKPKTGKWVTNWREIKIFLEQSRDMKQWISCSISFGSKVKRNQIKCM